MRHAHRLIAATAAAALVLAGCADTSDLGPGSDPDPAEPPASDDSEDEETDNGAAGDVESDADDSDPEGEHQGEVAADDVEASTDGWRYVEEFDTPVVWEENGVRVSVTGIGLTDVTSDEVPADVAGALDDDTVTVVVLEMTVSNDTGRVIDFYPNQGTIQLLREQADANIWLSDIFAGSELRDGVDDSGQVLWELTATSYADAVQAGQLDFVTSPAHTSEGFDDLAGPVELTVAWTAP